jgi:hypothetical protein
MASRLRSAVVSFDAVPEEALRASSLLAGAAGGRTRSRCLRLLLVARPAGRRVAEVGARSASLGC